MPLSLTCGIAPDLNAASVTKLSNWLNQGAPFDAATATTLTEVDINQTSTQLRGTVNTNTLNSPVTFNGQWWFEWGTGSSGFYNQGIVGTTVRNSTSSTTATHTLGGLVCGTTYEYRVRASNGNNTATGSQQLINIACTAPVISEGASTNQSTNEDTQDTFTLSRSDDDAGTLTWSVLTQGSQGTYSFNTSVFGSPVTVLYTPNAHANGADNAGVIRVTNGTTGLTDSISVNMSITAVPDNPVVSVDGTINYQEGDAAATLDSTITVSEFDGQSIQGATVVVSNYVAADAEVLACTGTLGSGNLTGITGCSFSAGTLTLTGTTTTTNYRNALQTVTYFNPSSNPTVGDRTVQFRVQDSGGAFSAIDSVTVSISSVSTPPTITGFSGVAAYTENGSVVIDSSVSITDPDSPVGSELNRAQLTLTTNFNAGQDSLVCPVSLPGGISCSYVAPTLTLSSAGSSLANYATAIQQVEYSNSSNNPATATRTVTLTARDVSNTVSSIVSKTITIAPVNDAPVINATAPTTALVLTEEVPVSIYNVNTPAISDPDDNSFTYSLGGTGLAGDTAGGDMSVSAGGLVSWTPPRTGVFNNPTATVTVTASDQNDSAGANGILADVQMFSIATSPLDSDSDGVADYSDNCPAIANAGQEDLDADTTYGPVDVSGIPATGDVDASARDNANALVESYLRGGDACDEDVDGDGISKVFEDGKAYLSDTNAADATLDEDGDGISNRDEFLASTDPGEDSVGPIVTAPADVTVNSTGYLTVVDIGVASAGDGLDGSIATVVPVVDAAIGDCASLGDFPLIAPAFRPGAHVVTWASCDSKGNLGTDTQNVNVRPLLNTTPGQNTGEGTNISIEVMLNGPAVSYPVSVDYTVAGFANSGDHNLTDGTLTISQTDVDGNNPGRVARLNVAITDDAASEDVELFIVSLINPVNAVLGTVAQHQVLIYGFDTKPELALAVSQGGVATGHTVYQDGANAVVINVTSTDTLPSTVISFDWSATASAIDTSAGNITTLGSMSSLAIDLSSLSAGQYAVAVSASDAGEATTSSLVLNVVAATPNLANCTVGSNADCDGDGIDNVTEGAADSDSDGIADYLDDANFVDNSVLQNQTGNPSNSFVLQTDAGLRLRTGTTAQASGVPGALIGQQNIDEHGGQAGGVGVATADTYTNVGGYYDFEITGLNGTISTAQVVIPLQAAILFDAQYRKYDGTAWGSFVEDANNRVSSTRGELGVCPAPGSSDYTPGLTAFDFCVQLTLQDGGPNDADGVRDFVIRDPGGVGIPPESAPVAAAADGRIGVLHPLLLVLLSGVSWWFYRRRRA